MPHLFKYVTFGTARKIIEKGTLRWSTPSTLNDPFDMQFAFQIRVDRQTTRTMALDKTWQHFYGELLDRPLNDRGRSIRHCRDIFPAMNRDEFNQEIGVIIDEDLDKIDQNIARFNEIMQDVCKKDKIFCLPDTPDSILMWSYYAQNHTGLVLRFTDETPGSPLLEARRVRYVDQIPSLLDDGTLSDFFAGYDDMERERFLDELVWTKSHHWAHEREWRISASAGRSDGPYEDVPFNARELDGVIFGVRTAENDRTALVELLKTLYPHVEFFQAKTRTDVYELTIESANY